MIIRKNEPIDQSKKRKKVYNHNSIHGKDTMLVESTPRRDEVIGQSSKTDYQSIISKNIFEENVKVWPQEPPINKTNTGPMSQPTTNNANKTAPANIKKTKLNPTVSN